MPNKKLIVKWDHRGGDFQGRNSIPIIWLFAKGKCGALFTQLCKATLWDLMVREGVRVESEDSRVLVPYQISISMQPQKIMTVRAL